MVGTHVSLSLIRRSNDSIPPITRKSTDYRIPGCSDSRHDWNPKGARLGGTVSRRPRVSSPFRPFDFFEMDWTRQAEDMTAVMGQIR